LKQYNLSPLKNYDDFTNHVSKGDVKTKGIWINTDQAGSIQHVCLKKKGSANAKSPDGTTSNSAIDEEIAGIKQRTKRAAELDDEKVYARILTSMQSHITQKEVPKNISVIPTPEWAALLFIVFDKAGYSLDKEFDKNIGITGKPEQVYEKLKNLSKESITYMVRRVMMANYGGNYPKNDYAFIIRKMAESYGDIPLVEYELEQQEKRTKREERAAQRIKALQDQKKADKVKTAKKK
jgi:hypothetical protein